MGGRVAGMASRGLDSYGKGQVGVDDRDSHDVEDAAGVGVFRVGQFLVAAPVVVGDLDFAVDLAAIGAFKVNAVFAVGGDGGADDRVGGLFLGDFFDVEGFLVRDLELGA